MDKGDEKLRVFGFKLMDVEIIIQKKQEAKQALKDASSILKIINSFLGKFRFDKNLSGKALGMSKMTSYREKEWAVFERFKDGEVIESDEQMRILERWALTGMASFGCTNNEGTAKITEKGKIFLPVLLKK